MNETAPLPDGLDAHRPTDDRSPALRPLDPRAITLWRAGTLGRTAFFLALAIAAEMLLELPWRFGLIPALVFIAGGAAVLLIPPLRYEIWRFALRDDHVYLRRGVLFRASSIVPHARIQHVDTQHGPLDRWLGLASLVIYTAGTRGAVLTIPALEADEAERLRDRLAALSGAGDAV